MNKLYYMQYKNNLNKCLMQKFILKHIKEKLT